MIRRCHRDEFTQEEFDRRAREFAAIPSRWATGAPGPDGTVGLRLADLWDAGGAGLVSVLPLLVRVAAGTITDGFALSREELSRLAGCDPKSVDRRGASWTRGAGRRPRRASGTASGSSTGASPPPSTPRAT
jgi:hypothetical protein